MSREIIVLCGCGQRNTLRRWHGSSFLYKCVECGSPVAQIEPLARSQITRYAASVVKWSVSLVALAGLLHLLTQPAASPGLAIGTVPARANTSVAVHDSGIVRRRLDTAAAISFEADTSSNYAVRLVDLETAREEMLIFIAAGESFEAVLRPGNYRVTAALGSQWINDDELFGPETAFFRLDARGVSGSIRLGLGDTRVVRLRAGPASALQRTSIGRDEF